jgi:hypothetical protein
VTRAGTCAGEERLTNSAEELSEEDQQLKNELDMLAERILVSHDPLRLSQACADLPTTRNPTPVYTSPRSTRSRTLSRRRQAR